MEELSEARQLCVIAAAQGHADAQCSLGLIHYRGQGGLVSHSEARRLLGLAAAQGHADAQYNLGIMHYCITA